MSRIVGLSGAQGGGKTTLLDGLKEHGYEVDDFKVSRWAQQQLGWSTLENVMADPGTMMTFQRKILEMKLLRERFNQQESFPGVILTERTFADIASYTQLWAWELVHAGSWSIGEAMKFTLPYVEECAHAQLIYEGCLILPYMPHVAWQTDPLRAKREHLAFFTDQLDRFYEVKNPKDVPVFRITEGSIQGRIDQVHNWIKTL